MFSSIFPKKAGAKTLPSFKLGQKKEERKGGAVSLWDKADKPGGESPLGIPDLAKPAAPRLLRHGLNFRDAKFIIAGLVVLMAAPFAEMLLGGSTDPATASFPSRDFAFPGTPQPHEEGVLGLAAGGPPGLGDESAVTPLNASDPTKLVMAYGGGPEPAAEVKPAPAAPAPKKAAGGWRDALAQAARPAVEKASHSASLPRAPGKIAGALRGLAAIAGGGGGGGASVAAPKLAPPAPMGSSGRPAVASALSRVQATPGYKGAAMQGLSVSSGGRGPSPAANRVYDGGRGAGGGDSGYGGLPGGYLQAQQAMQAMGPGGGFGSGGGGAEKGPSLNSLKDARTQTEKETLAQMKAKMEMQKAIDLKWEKKKYEQLDRKKMLEQIAAQTLAQTASQAFLKVLDAILKKATEEKKEGT